jgi:hypothetical protein
VRKQASSPPTLFTTEDHTPYRLSSKLTDRKPRESREIKVDVEVRLPTWSGTFHSTGWMASTLERLIEEKKRAPTSEIINPDKYVQGESPELEAKRMAYALMRKGAQRAPDTIRQPGLDTKTPEALQTSKDPLHLKDYQLQSRQTLLDDYHEEAMVCFWALRWRLAKR